MTGAGDASRRLLFVSGSTADRENVVETFRRSGFTTLLASTAADACRLALELPPVVVIVDVALSVCDDGIPLARRLKESGRLHGVPIVIVDGRAVAGEETLVQAGVDMFVARPSSIRSLEATTARLLRSASRGASVTLPTPVTRGRLSR